MSVTTGNIVRIDCELTLAEGGDVIESSKKTGPVEYKHGAGQMLKGLEKQLEGMKVGDEKSGVIPAAEAFGTENTQPTMTIPKKEFPKDSKIKVGDEFEAKNPQGIPVKLKVETVDDEKVVARVVHPLAGKDVAFKVKVLATRPPPPPVPKIEEIDAEPAESDPNVAAAAQSEEKKSDEKPAEEKPS